jgi:MFS family permease
MGSLPPGLPDLQRMMQIKEGLLGVGLIGTAAGTLVSLGFSGPILERIGYRRSILTLIPLLALLYAIASFADGSLAFFLLLFPVGIVIGGIEIILNLEADRTEHLIGHRIMNRAHAFWSLGFSRRASFRRWGAGADAVLCRSVRRALFADRCVAGAAQGARRGRAAGVFRP